MKFQLLFASLVNLLLVAEVLSVVTVESTNWAGFVDSDANAGWKSVTGTVVVPTPSAPSGTGGYASASIWVGIDGATCRGKILQTGFDVTVNNSVVSYEAWHEWYPALDINWSTSEMAIHAGDTITMTVTALSSTTGNTSITNHNTGRTVWYEYIGDSHPLQGCDAAWIIEDYNENGQQVPFADFGTVEFTTARATAANGSVYGPGGNPSSVVWQLGKNGQALTSCSATTTEGTCNYV